MKMTKFYCKSKSIHPELADLIEDHADVIVYVTDERGQEIINSPAFDRTALHYETGIELEDALSKGDPRASVWIGGNCWQIMKIMKSG